MHTSLTARRLITDGGQLDFPVLEMDEEGRLVSIGTDPQVLANESTTLSSALLDIHLHGAGGVDVTNASPAQMRELTSFLARHGVGYFLPTTVTAPVDFTLRALERIAKTIDSSGSIEGATPLGIHIEGPFLSHTKRGMHPSEHLQAPSIELFDRLQSAAGGHIRLITIAPEAEAGPFVTSGFERVSALDLIRYASRQGVACSIGHSNALASEAVAAIEAGAVSATHTFNAMRPLDHREPGILGVVLQDDRIFADLICDGVHVSPEAVRLWWKAKGAQRAILITDALPAAGIGDGNFRVGDAWITAHQGRALVSRDLAQGTETLAGSVLMLPQAVKNFVDFTAAEIKDGLRLASHNPAAMLKRSDVMRLEPGSPVNLTRWDEARNLVTTYLRGLEVKR
jgi:N-acetylglucosamine-6-phosphate deacetylase